MADARMPTRSAPLQHNLKVTETYLVDYSGLLSPIWL